jgi:preprotein translocase subunit SecG
MFTFLLVVHAIIAAVLVGVILMQKSEGGGLGTGGSPGGLMSARGAADFLTRSTTVLATAFVGMSILLAVIASSGQTVRIDPSLATKPVAGNLPAAAPVDADSAAAVAANQITPATAPTNNNAVPLAQ